ncbi:MAG: dTMP kinase [Anaeroplasmataceae bacterium]
MSGLFITFEGTEGSGKTTIINEVKDYLNVIGNNVVVTREPGGVDLSEKIRSIILDVNNHMCGETEALLYAAARVEHLNEIVLPSLKEGKIVLCDRYIDSSLAYQGYARGLGVEKIEAVNFYAMEHLPNVTFFIDIKPVESLARISNRDDLDRLDLESIDFHNKVYEGYLMVCDEFKERIIKIDGSQPVEIVIADVLSKLSKYLKTT